MAWLLVGIAIGILIALPLTVYSARRAARRVRRLERRTRQAEHLAELGTMTGGLAHEIKNPLSTIGLNLQLLNEAVDDAEIDEPHAGRLKRRLDAISDEVDRLRGILDDFLAFAGRMQLDRQPAKLNEVIEEMADFYAPQAEASGVHLRTVLSDKVGEVPLDAKMFKRALLNLLVNATQAMVQARYDDKPHGGAEDLMIRTEPAGDEVVVHVIDTGPGIDDEKLRKVFQPYFTTKKGGTGLGLAITRRIAEEHGGHITVHTDSGRGTDFTIHLPRDPDADESGPDD